MKNIPSSMFSFSLFLAYYGNFLLGAQEQPPTFPLIIKPSAINPGKLTKKFYAAWEEPNSETLATTCKYLRQLRKIGIHETLERDLWNVWFEKFIDTCQIKQKLVSLKDLLNLKAAFSRYIKITHEKNLIDELRQKIAQTGIMVDNIPTPPESPPWRKARPEITASAYADDIKHLHEHAASPYHQPPPIPYNPQESCSTQLTQRPAPKTPTGLNAQVLTEILDKLPNQFLNFTVTQEQFSEFVELTLKILTIRQILLSTETSAAIIAETKDLFTSLKNLATAAQRPAVQQNPACQHINDCLATLIKTVINYQDLIILGNQSIERTRAIIHDTSLVQRLQDKINLLAEQFYSYCEAVVNKQNVLNNKQLFNEFITLLTSGIIEFEKPFAIMGIHEMMHTLSQLIESIIITASPDQINKMDSKKLTEFNEELACITKVYSLVQNNDLEDMQSEEMVEIGKDLEACQVLVNKWVTYFDNLENPAEGNE